MKKLKRFAALALMLVLLSALSAPALAGRAELQYKPILTDQNGREVGNPRALGAGDTLHVEIELTRTDTDAASYTAYGLEFRLSSRGLRYNGDGASFRNGTPITRQVFLSGDSVGFAYYDMERIGEAINNPVLAARWSYTVTEPSAVNITVPVALMYITDGSESAVPVGNARLLLDPNGGTLAGIDVSGDYPSGTVVTLPDAAFAGYTFLGWSDGAKLYEAGQSYTVTGFVTLSAMWEGLVRDRRVLFDPNGGSILGDDPSGMYADGEVIPMPTAQQDGFELSGWTLDGRLYGLDESYTVDNSVIFCAEWTEAGLAPQETEKTEPSAALLPVALSILAALGLGWWLLLLWRRYVRYSLLDGGIRLSYRDRKRVSFVQVYLETDGREYLLDQSGEVGMGRKLRLINGTHVLDGVKKGLYRGRLHITYTGAREARDVKVRIRAMKKEFNEEQ